jgi:hypothetical protein
MSCSRSIACTAVVGSWNGDSDSDRSAMSTSIRRPYGAGVKGGDLVALRFADGEDDDRHAAPAAQAADHLDAVDPGQAEVEDDEIGVLPGRDRKSGLAVLGEVDVVAALAGW